MAQFQISINPSTDFYDSKHAFCTDNQCKLQLKGDFYQIYTNRSQLVSIGQELIKVIILDFEVFFILLSIKVLTNIKKYVSDPYDNYYLNFEVT